MKTLTKSPISSIASGESTKGQPLFIGRGVFIMKIIILLSWVLLCFILGVLMHDKMVTDHFPYRNSASENSWQTLTVIQVVFTAIMVFFLGIIIMVIAIKKEWHNKLSGKNNPWAGRYNPSQNATGNTITLSLKEHKDSHSKESLSSKQFLNVYNYDTEEYDKYEMTDAGCKNVKTGEIVDSPFTQLHLNEMCLQTNLMKSALGENNN